MDSCNSRDGVAVEIEGKSDIFQRLSDIEKKAVYNLVKKLITMLTSYCTQLPVLGYRPISRVVIGRKVDYRSRLIYVRYCLTNTTLCL